jgi:NRPS condensation-like uncharacterized protein
MPDSLFWMPLDNAAKIYPAIRTDELTSVFRLSVVLKERVKARQLLEAVNALEERFPYYKVTLKIGVFWFYLEHDHQAISVKPDLDIPCRAFHKHELMFRVLVRENCISVEFSHILTDATGGLEFLKSLLFSYFLHCGITIPETVLFLRPGETPDYEEYEDAYNRYFKRTVSPRMNLRAAFHLPFSLNRPSRLNISVFEIPADAILKKARSSGLSLTEYLISIYLFALQSIYETLPALQQRAANRILRIEVPVNLRNFYPSRTMRNFSVYVLPEIDLRLGHYTFEEAAETVHHLMQLETNKKLIHKILSRNVGGERNLIVKRIPLFIKSFLLKTFYSLGTSRYSGVVTNLGRVTFPSEISQLIDKFIFIPPPPSKKLKANCGVVGFGNKLTLCFGNITSSDLLEQKFSTFLYGQDIPHKIIRY